MALATRLWVALKAHTHTHTHTHKNLRTKSDHYFYIFSQEFLYL